MDPDIYFATSDIPLEQIVPIDQKRLLAFVNFWLGRTTQFLISFAFSAEEKVIAVERKLSKLENSLVLLERKLDSIPGLEDIVLIKENNENATIASNGGVLEDGSVAAAADTDGIDDTAEQQQQQQHDEIESEDVAVITAESQGTKVRNDSRFEKYFKMIKLGIPLLAVKQKMRGDGVDPSLLDTPDAVAPPGDIAPPPPTRIDSLSDDEFDNPSSDSSSDMGDA